MTQPLASARLLIAAERSKQDHVPALLRALPAIVGFGNLFLLAFGERYLAQGPEVYALQLLLFLETGALLGLAFTHFNQRMDEILRKTRVFPIDRWERFLYALRSLASDRSVLALVASTAIGLGIVFRREPPVVAAACVTLTALSAAAIVIFVLVLLWFTGKSVPPSVIAWAGGMGIAGVILSSLLFGYDSLLDAFIPVVWGANAIHFAATREYVRSAVSVALLLLCSIVPLLAAWMFQKDTGGRQ